MNDEVLKSPFLPTQAASSIQNVARYKIFLRFHAVLSAVFWFKRRAKQTANQRADKIYSVS